jgi:hypothetical protein
VTYIGSLSSPCTQRVIAHPDVRYGLLVIAMVLTSTALAQPAKDQKRWVRTWGSAMHAPLALIPGQGSVFACYAGDDMSDGPMMVTPILIISSRIALS